MAIYFLDNNRKLPEKESYPDESDRIPVDVLFATINTWRSPVFGRLQVEHGDKTEALNSEDWQSVAESVKEILVEKGRNVPFADGGELAELFCRWGKNVLDCLLGIPYHWTKDFET